MPRLPANAGLRSTTRDLGSFLFRFVVVIVVGGSLFLTMLYVAAAGGAGPLLPWQLLAALVAIFLVTMWLVIGLRIRRRATTVLIGLLCLPSAAGFAAYAVFGGPEPQHALVVALAAVFYTVVMVAMLIAIFRRLRARPTSIGLGTADRRFRRGLIARLIATAWLAAFLFAFEPLFAAAYVAVNVAWEAIWIPRRWRTSKYEYTAQIPAPRQDVFDFVADPANWSRYRDDIEVVDVNSPGPLRKGSTYVARIPMPATATALKEKQLEITVQVIDVVPGRSMSSRSTARPGDVTVTTVSDAPNGSRIAFQTSSVVSFILASQGAMLSLAREKADLTATYELRTAKLKQIFEAAPN